MAGRVAAWLVALLLLAPPAAAQFDALRQGRLGHLAGLIGSYDYDAVLNDPLVAERLDRLLGDDVAVLRRNLEVHPGIDFIAGHLVLQGNAPHRGYEEEAMLWVGLHDGGLRVALLHRGRFLLYAPAGAWEYLPRELRAFFFPRSLDDRPQPPDGLVWITAP